MEVPVIVDGRNIYDPATVRQAGFEYISIGREGVYPQAFGPIRQSPLPKLNLPVQEALLVPY
jgi:hypothetical protein